MRAGSEVAQRRALDLVLKVREGFLKEGTSELKPEGPLCVGQTDHEGWQASATGVGDDPHLGGTVGAQCGGRRDREGKGARLEGHIRKTSLNMSPAEGLCQC